MTLITQVAADMATLLDQAIEARDIPTARHEEIVASFARRIGRKLGLSKDVIDAIGVIGMVHDIGKLSIPSEILLKPGRLDGQELAIVRKHSAVGAEILRGVEFPWPVAAAVRQHHERLDGSGYPDGLKGSDILLEAQIVAVADVVDALGSNRPYRPALVIIAIRDELLAARGTGLHAGAVDAALAILEAHEFPYGA